jgi:hypothetical protein
MNVTGVSPRLSRHIGYTVSSNNVSTKEITICKSEDALRPTRNVEGAVIYFKRKVPYYSFVCLLTFISMLRYTLRVALAKINKKNLPRQSASLSQRRI